MFYPEDFEIGFSGMVRGFSGGEKGLPRLEHLEEREVEDLQGMGIGIYGNFGWHVDNNDV